jgi:phage terminase large subunit-like protein
LSLTVKQEQAMSVLAGGAKHVMLEGGSRSGKTFLLTRAVCMRAIKAPKSRHAIFRFRFNHLKASIIADTFPKVMQTCFDGVKYRLDRSDWFAEWENGAQCWFGGLDDKDRVDKILGQEHATLYFNEISQISYGSVQTAMSRLAQRVDQVVGDNRSPLKPRAYYDLNPTNKNHWAYRLFHEQRDPETKEQVPHPADYAFMRLNPSDNVDNLADGYLDTLRSLGSRQRKRFLDGDWADANPNALFSDEDIEKWRVLDGRVPEFVRVVVAVDPSGADDDDNADNDAIGIAVVGLGTDGNAYLLEDATVKAGPATWGRVATSAFERHKADAVVGEINYGGAMVQHVIQVARPRTPFRKVTATRGKTVRAEPFSALYEQGKVRHVGHFSDLEEELSGFSTHGYVGTGSPNRADALVWALAELFPGLTRGETATTEPDETDALLSGYVGSGGWMG